MKLLFLPGTDNGHDLIRNVFQSLKDNFSGMGIMVKEVERYNKPEKTA